MPKLTLGASGILVALAGSVLVHYGFSDSCSNEITQLAPVFIGGLMTWVHNVKSGTQTVMGGKPK